MSYQIHGDAEDAHLAIYVDGYQVFGCTLNHVAADYREWMAKHLTEAFHRCAVSAAEKAITQHNAELRKLLDIR